MNKLYEHLHGRFIELYHEVMEGSFSNVKHFEMLSSLF